ncbi:MAG TPA: ATP-binding protein [Candidatus Angelobacter sp.]|nr:ATP-binding protein [Candidatus Angelobacter sp.]
MLNSSPTSKNSAKHAPSRPWRLHIAVILCSVLPLLLFLYAGHQFIRRFTVNSLLQQTATDLAAKVIEQNLTDTQASLQSLAQDSSMIDDWTKMDLPRIMIRLQDAHALKHDVAVWAVYDAKGILRASRPSIAGGTKQSVASTAWFKSVEQTRRVYVSGVFQDELTGRGPIVTVAAPIVSGNQLSGVLAVTYDLETIKRWLAGMPPSATRWISVVDQNGVIVVAPDRDGAKAARDVSAYENVKKVIAGKGGTEFLWQDGKQILVGRRPLSSVGWGVLVEFPVEEVDKAIWRFERRLSWIALLFVLLALAIGGAGVVLYNRLRESREHVRQIVTTANDAFIAINEAGIIIDWNPQAVTLFGWTEEEAIGQPLHDTIIPPSYREAHLRGLTQFLATGNGPVLNRTLELTALDRNEREFPVELSIWPMRKEGRITFNAFLRDISVRKKAEQQIAKLNAELAHRVSELEARNKELEAFSYSVSHDVRAPLRHIAGFSQLLLEECKELISPDGREYLQEIQHSTRRLQQLVEDLLRFSRLGAQGMKLQMTNLGEVVEEVVASVGRDLGGRKVTFDVAPLPIAECDRALIKQVFMNLISNAVKFTATRDHAVIKVGEYHQGGENIFFVRDNGVGFDMKNAERLFEPFHRLHSQEQFEGTGVGLATVQRIILKHHGRVWAESESDHGASFFFSLPPGAYTSARVSAQNPL